MQIDVQSIHTDKGAQKYQWDADRNNIAATPPQTEQADGQHDDYGFQQAVSKFADRIFNYLRLVSNLIELKAQRQILFDLFGRPYQVSSSLMLLPPSCIEIAIPTAGWPLKYIFGSAGSA